MCNFIIEKLQSHVSLIMLFFFLFILNIVNHFYKLDYKFK